MTSENTNLTKAPLTAEDIERQHQQQDEIDAAQGVEDNLDTGSDTGAAADNAGDDGEPQQRAPAIRMSPQDAAREKIANRFRREDSVPFDGDMTKDENLYGSVARQELEPDPDAAEPGVPRDQQRQAPSAQDKTYTIKVRGQEIHLTEAQLLERASKVEAADSYLAESRDLLEQAKGIRNERAEHAGRDDQRHPVDRQSSTQDDEQNRDDNQSTRRPGPDLEKLVEEIQFGDPKEAAAKLGQAIVQAADDSADKRQLNRLMKNDLTKSQQALQDFETTNPDIAKDPNAAALMEKNIYDIFREDIVKLGVVDADKIPTDKKTLADWHRFYRVNGQPVSDIKPLLEEAKKRVVSWRGPASTSTKPTPRRDAPRVEVNVDRTARREAIPNQPTRAVAPRANPTQQTAPAKGSDVVKEMRRARGQPV